MKFTTGLIAEYNQTHQIEQQQDALRAKHNIDDENVVVVEKRSLLKITASIIGAVLRFAAIVAISCFAIIGLVALVIPASRDALLVFWQDTMTTLQGYFS